MPVWGAVAQLKVCYFETHRRQSLCVMGPQGFLGSGENGYSFSGSWGALVIILGEVGSKLINLGI